MPLTVGAKAPGFTLFDTDRKPRTLSEFEGKPTILAFFPGAFTGVCTREMCSLRDSLGDFEKLKAQVVAISVDAPAANRGFALQNRLGFPILSDYTREVSTVYGGLEENFGGLPGYSAARRSVFVLDGAGMVRYRWISDNAGQEPDYDAIRKALADL